MPKELTVDELRKQYQKKVNFIDHSLTLFDSDIQRLQKELLNFLISEVVMELQTENGIILQSAKNIQILDSFYKEMDLFKKNFADSVFKRLGENMIKTTGYTSDYFRNMTSAQTIANIEDKIQQVTRMTGVNPDGTLVKNGFLNRLAVTDEMKQAVSDYIRTGVERQVDLKQFAKGLKELTVSKEGANGIYDSTSKAMLTMPIFRNHNNKIISLDYLGLNYFVYGGTEIKTSRPFCVGGKDVVKDGEIIAEHVFENKLWQASRKDAEEFDK